MLCGVPAALALPKVGRYSRALFTVVLSLGLSAPTIVTAFADFEVYSQLGVGSHLTPVAVAVAVTSFPFMLWTVLAAIQDLDCRAPARRPMMSTDPVQQFLLVNCCLLVWHHQASVVVFVLSITDFVVSQVLTTVDDQTPARVHLFRSARGDFARPGCGFGAVHRRGGGGFRRRVATGKSRAILVPNSI